MTVIGSGLVVRLMLASAAIAAPALASESGDTPRFIVHFNDLNLSTDAGALALQHRVRHVAESLCGDADSRDLRATLQARSCLATAMASAAPQIELALAEAKNNHAYASSDRIAVASR